MFLFSYRIQEKSFLNWCVRSCYLLHILRKLFLNQFVILAPFLGHLKVDLLAIDRLIWNDSPALILILIKIVLPIQDGRRQFMADFF